jgi:DNA-binding NarL/FixJ family response regulator
LIVQKSNLDLYNVPYLIMRKARILLVDDNPHFLNALRFMLQDYFSERIETIEIATNGEECIEALRTKLVDLVFMDINMPKMDGIETTKEIVKMFRDIIVIAVSFHSEMKYIVQMIEAGARNYIIKEEINKEILDKVLTEY